MVDRWWHLCDAGQLKEDDVTKIYVSDLDVDSWFERDRAMVAIVNRETDETLVEWWDEAVQELVDAGFLDVKDLKRTAIKYAIDTGAIRVSK